MENGRSAPFADGSLVGGDFGAVNEGNFRRELVKSRGRDARMRGAYAGIFDDRLKAVKGCLAFGVYPVLHRLRTLWATQIPGA